MTGIGINLREMPDSNGSFKLKVLGLVLDGPANTAGIRQVTGTTCCLLICFNFQCTYIFIIMLLELLLEFMVY